jgi:hypothetical protein
MDKIQKFVNKVYDTLGKSEAEKIMNSFYGQFTPFSVTEKQGEILDNIYQQLVGSEYFSELLADASTKMQERLGLTTEKWKLAWVMLNQLQDELFAIAMTDSLKESTLSEETIRFFAEYTIGRFLTDGTQLARSYDKTENTLEYLESMIAENGEEGYKTEIDELFDLD